MFKFYRSVLAAGVVALGLAACGDDVTVVNPPPPPPGTVSSVVVTPANATVGVGQTIQLAASVTADSGISTALDWTTSNALIATVSSTGLVTGVAPGSTTIIATSHVNSARSAAVSITVAGVVSGITSFGVTPTVLTLSPGFSFQPSVQIQTTPGTTVTIVWTTSAASVATVNATTGAITGVAAGTATITATATAGGQSTSATIGVTVSATAPPGVISFAIIPSTMTLAPGQSSQASANITMSPGFATPTVTWVSLTPAIATVSSTGLITGVSQGSAVVTGSITGGGVTLTGSVAVSVGAGASISINSVNAGATAATVSGCSGVAGLPVVLTDVNCQIDVVLNLTGGVQPLDSLVIYVQRGTVAALAPTFQGKATPVCATAAAPCPFFRHAAEQLYGNTIPSTGPVTLLINTANFTKNQAAGVATVDYFNGPTALISQLFPHNLVGGSVFNCQIGASDPQCAVVNSMIFTNTDGWAADLNKCSSLITPAAICPAAVPAIGAAGANASTGGFAIDVDGSSFNTGKTYWGGPGVTGQITAELYAVVYNDNPGFVPGSSLNRCNNQLGNGTGCISTVSWTIGSTSIPSGHCDFAAQSATVTPATPLFQQTFGSSGAGLTNDCSTHQNILTRRDNVMVTSGTLDAQSNNYPSTPLIPNTVVFGATPDSFRLDWAAPSSVTQPTVDGAESFNWVNHNWVFNPGGTLVTDNGVGPAPLTWRAFATLNGGSTVSFPTSIVTGRDLAETNQNCTGAGCDGYLAQAWATDLLGNSGNSGATSAFGDDQTSPRLRYSTIAAPSAYASIYTAGGAATVMDSTTYNAVQGVYGANVVTAGAQDLFLAAAAGTNDTFRIEALDNRSGLSRAVEKTRNFAQGGATGTTTTVTSTTAGVFGAATLDGWLPAPPFHVTNGRAGGAPPATPGYYTTTGYVIDRAGNVSGCPTVGTVAVPITISGSICSGAVAGPGVPSTIGGTNPAMSGAIAPAGSANLFWRRTLALDPGQPLITGVSPNNNYTGNSPQTWSLGSQNDLEVIDERLRIQYPNLSIGDVAGTFGASQGLVWSYSLSNTFMGASPNGNTCNGPTSAAPTAGGCGIGFFLPIGVKFDGSIINPIVTGSGGIPAMSQDQFTLNVQETCTTATGIGSPATGPTTAAACGTIPTAIAAGDPIPCLVTSNGCVANAGGIALAKPSNLAVQTRDVFGAWIFNTTASAVTGVSAEFVSPILPATVAAPGGYTVTYFNAGAATSCPQGGVVQPVNTTTCVNTGINFRQDGGASSTRNFRAVESLSTTLPTFTRVDLFGLNAAGEWVWIQRCTVPATIIPNTGPQGCGGGTVTGTDNGNERYWVYSFTSIPTTGFGFFRAIGVNSSGYGLASTRQP